MMTLTFIEFLDGTKYPDDEGYTLYIAKDNEDDILYVGISRDNIWNRWFAAPGRSHMFYNIYGELIGSSNIGRYILENRPLSDNWNFEFWKLEDCLKYLNIEFIYDCNMHLCLNTYGAPYDIRSIEPKMIAKLKPKFNVFYNH